MAVRRIVHLMASNFLGGPERQLLGHALAADPGKWEIILASFPEGGNEPAFIDSARRQGIAAAMVPATGAYDIRAPWKIADMLRGAQADVLCAHGYRGAILGPGAAYFAGVPLVSVWRGWTWENAKVRAFQAAACAALRFADRVVAVSHAMARRLAAYGMGQDRIAVVWNAIDPRRLPPASDDLRQQLRGELTLPRDSRVLVSAGRLSAEKGHAFLLQAMPEITTRDSRAVLLVIGDGPLRRRLERLAARLGMGPHVRFLGFRPDAHRVIAASDLLVLPSLSEGLPNVVLEAMAIGVPVVATRVGGVPELVRDPEVGWLVKPGDARALAAAACEALADGERRARISARGRELVCREFTFDQQARRLQAVYEEVLSRPSRYRRRGAI